MITAIEARTMLELVKSDTYLILKIIGDNISSAINRGEDWAIIRIFWNKDKLQEVEEKLKSFGYKVSLTYGVNFAEKELIIDWSNNELNK